MVLGYLASKLIQGSFFLFLIFLTRFFKLNGCNRSPAPHFRPTKPPGIANYSPETSLNESGALDERLRTYVMQSFEGSVNAYEWILFVVFPDAF